MTQQEEIHEEVRDAIISCLTTYFEQKVAGDDPGPMYLGILRGLGEVLVFWARAYETVQLLGIDQAMKQLQTETPSSDDLEHLVEDVLNEIDEIVPPDD